VLPARGVTYRRAVHLLLGAVLLLPYLLLGIVFARVLGDPGSPRPALPLILAVALVLGATPAFLHGTRAVEIAAARLLLDVDLPQPVSRRPARLPLETRIRAAAWFGLHLFAGGLVALVMLTAFPMALIFILHRLGLADEALAGFRLGPLDEGDAWWWSLIGVLLLIATAYAVAGLGALAALMAPVLLGPSQSERIAALQAESQRLAEGNRIARELHDTIGHALTATTLQASAARELFDSDPAFARRALEAIERVGRDAMNDLDDVVGVLREHGAAWPGTADVPERARRREQPTLMDVSGLCEEVRDGGLAVTLEVSGTLDGVPAEVSREGYRIVQEALTNVARHAGRVPVTVRVAAGPDVVNVEITNPVTGDAGVARGGGRGLDGLRERVDLLGGQLNAGPTGATWRLTTRLPFATPGHRRGRA
jgi:signal transduction histidine kinase